MELSKYLRDYSRTIPGKQQLLIGAYAKALEVIPRQLCDNAGFDATNILNKLRAKHAQVGHECHVTDEAWGLTGAPAAGWDVVRRGHQQRGHRRQLQRLRLGAVHRADQRPDGRIRGRLSHPICGRDDQEPAQLHRRTPGWRRQRQGPWKTPRSLRRAEHINLVLSGH